MKHLFIGSAILTAVSGLVSLFLFLNPMPETFLPHWAIPLFSAACLLILIGAQHGPDPKHPERDFGRYYWVCQFWDLYFNSII